MGGFLSHLCGGLFKGGGGPGEAPEHAPVVTFDTECHGKQVNVSNFNATGSGVALASSALVQDKAYFEITYAREGSIAVGVAKRNKKLGEYAGHIGDDAIGAFSWGIRESNIPGLKVGDVIGCYYDQSDYPRVFYTHNGERLDTELKGIKGEVSPAISVGDNSMVEANFGHLPFKHEPISGFQCVMPAIGII